ncbi:MAG: ABC transporter substrate-binding protein [Desulfobacteraceae bacterium]|nr:ABC transporter substrate-binding protein [Desulfobacteraceae bacterium]
MMYRRVSIACLMLTLCTVWFAAPLRAESGATATVKSVLDRAMEIQTRTDLQGSEHRKERSQMIRKLIGDNFASSEMARESLQDQWEKLSGKQREQYTALFIGLFEDSYTRRVLDFLKKETVEYPGESAEGKHTKVQTVIMRTNEHIPVDYMLEQKGQKWLIRDVIIDGVSAVETYRISFGQFIRNNSFEALLQRMRIQKKAGEDTRS